MSFPFSVFSLSPGAEQQMSRCFVPLRFCMLACQLPGSKARGAMAVRSLQLGESWSKTKASTEANFVPVLWRDRVAASQAKALALIVGCALVDAKASP